MRPAHRQDLDREHVVMRSLDVRQLGGRWRARTAADDGIAEAARDPGPCYS